MDSDEDASVGSNVYSNNDAKAPAIQSAAPMWNRDQWHLLNSKGLLIVGLQLLLRVLDELGSDLDCDEDESSDSDTDSSDDDNALSRKYEAAKRKSHQQRVLRDRSFVRHKTQLVNIDHLIRQNGQTYVEQLRMDRHTYGLLCELIRAGGKVSEDRNASVEEKVAMFLQMLAHRPRKRVIKFKFQRSRDTVDKYFHSVLYAIIASYHKLLEVPEPLPEDCKDEKWKWFKNCLGAMGGAYFKAHVTGSDKIRYVTRTNMIATYVMGACSPDMKFTYYLVGWEGSVYDNRVFTDAITRKSEMLKIPTGCYYLVDTRYHTNLDGFLAPFRDTHYHSFKRNESFVPTNHKEFFNMKHSSACSVIDRCFELIKLRWAIVSNPASFPVKTQDRIIVACTLLHNLIRREMEVDPMERELEVIEERLNAKKRDKLVGLGYTDEWHERRTNLAMQMFTEWRASEGQG